MTGFPALLVTTAIPIAIAAVVAVLIGFWLGRASRERADRAAGGTPSASSLPAGSPPFPGIPASAGQGHDADREAGLTTELRYAPDTFPGSGLGEPGSFSEPGTAPRHASAADGTSGALLPSLPHEPLPHEEDHAQPAQQAAHGLSADPFTANRADADPADGPASADPFASDSAGLGTADADQQDPFTSDPAQATADAETTDRSRTSAKHAARSEDDGTAPGHEPGQASWADEDAQEDPNAPEPSSSFQAAQQSSLGTLPEPGTAEPASRELPTTDPVNAAHARATQATSPGQDRGAEDFFFTGGPSLDAEQDDLTRPISTRHAALLSSEEEPARPDASGEEQSVVPSWHSDEAPATEVPRDEGRTLGPAAPLPASSDEQPPFPQLSATTLADTSTPEDASASADAESEHEQDGRQNGEQLAAAQRTIADLTDQIQQVTKQHAIEFGRLESGALAALEDTIAAYQQREQDLSAKLEQALEEGDRNRDELELLRNRADALQSSLAQRDARLAELHQRLTDMEVPDR